MARDLGVTKLMLVTDAKEKCPQLVLVKGEDLTHYRETSYKVTGNQLSNSWNELTTARTVMISQTSDDTFIFIATVLRSNEFYLTISFFLWKNSHLSLCFPPFRVADVILSISRTAGVWWELHGHHRDGGEEDGTDPRVCSLFIWRPRLQSWQWVA